MTQIANLFKVLGEKNISIKQLSEDTHISQGNIRDWKSGRSTPKADTLLTLSRYLNVSIDYLLNNEPFMNK